MIDRVIVLVHFGRRFDASCFKTSFVKTPQWNRARSSISSRRASSPAALMALRFVISMTGSRPSRCSLALVYSLRSSATQGSTRAPSTTSRHWRGLLMTEIFNMPHSSLWVRERNTLPKLCSCNYLKFQDGIEIGRNEVEAVNLGVLTRLGRAGRPDHPA